MTPKVYGGAYLLDGVERVLRRYVILPTDHHYAALPLWIMTTHAVEAFDYAPRLVLVSPEKRCGKTRTMEVAHPLCYHPLRTINTSVAALYRLNSKGRRTIFHDEADGVFGRAGRNDPGKEDLRVFYNGGFQRGEWVYRCVNGDTVQRFQTFAMAMLASIGDLPDTIMDRAVVFRMRRRANDEKVEPFRQRKAVGLAQSAKKLAAWAEANLEALGEADPASPLVDREADVWAPLLAVADVAGGEWPIRAREAAVVLTKSEATFAIDSPGALLLRDLRTLYLNDNRDHIPTGEMLTQLTDGRPDYEGHWENYSRDKALNPRQLSDLLRPYQLRSAQKKVGDTPIRGYSATVLREVWSRYLPAVETPAESTESAPAKRGRKVRAVVS